MFHMKHSFFVCLSELFHMKQNRLYKHNYCAEKKAKFFFKNRLTKVFGRSKIELYKGGKNDT